MRLKRSMRVVDKIINTTKTPVNVYTADGQIVTLEANESLAESRPGTLFLTDSFIRRDTVTARYAGAGRDKIDIWELHDKEGLRVYPRRG